MLTDYRSEAEKFVTAFIDYVDKHDIKDFFNKKTQKMERSPGVEALVQQAESVFPERTRGPSKLSEPELDAAVKAAPNVVDTREMFARKIQENGGTRELLRGVLAAEPYSIQRALEFLAAEDGTKEFRKKED